jgi:ribosomal protein L11 methyltransferase
VALRVASENARLNRLETCIQVTGSDLLANVRESADIIIANIITDVIISMAGQVYQKLTPGGLFIASGITNARLSEALAALTEAGFGLPDIQTMGEWSAIAARRI